MPSESKPTIVPLEKAVLIVAVLCGVLVVGGVIAARRYRHYVKYREMQELLHNVGRSDGLGAGVPQQVLRELGFDATSALLNEMSGLYEKFVYDGATRVIVVVRDNWVFTDLNDTSDTLELILLAESDSGDAPGAVWSGPPGMHVDTVRLVPSGVEVEYHIRSGEATVDSATGERQQLFIPWPPDTPPQSGLIKPEWRRERARSAR